LVRVAIFDERAHFRDISLGYASNAVKAKAAIMENASSVDVGMFDEASDLLELLFSLASQQSDETFG
jgi:hypothetical protein